MPPGLGLVTAMAVILAAACSSGCSVLGYAAGSAADTVHRRSTSVDRLASLPGNGHVWLKLQTGETVSGRLVHGGEPDSVRIEDQAPSSMGDPFAARRQRSYALGAIDSVETEGSAYRWLGFGVGSAVDVMIIVLVLTMDHSFHTYSVPSPLMVN